MVSGEMIVSCDCESPSVRPEQSFFSEFVRQKFVYLGLLDGDGSGYCLLFLAIWKRESTTKGLPKEKILPWYTEQ